MPGQGQGKDLMEFNWLPLFKEPPLSCFMVKYCQRVNQELTDDQTTGEKAKGDLALRLLERQPR